MGDRLRIIQHNVQSAYSKTRELGMLLNTRNIDIAILSETWEIPGANSINLGTNFNVESTPRADGYGGVAIVVHSAIQYEVLDVSMFRFIEVVGVRIFNSNNFLHIFSVYIPPSPRYSNRDIEIDLKNIFHIANRLGRSMICGDFNAHNQNWFSYKTDSRGIMIEQLILDYHLRIMNEDMATIIPKRPGQHSVVDLF